MNTHSIGKLLLALGATAAVLASPLASARDHVSWSVNVGVPAYPAYAAPVYAAPPVVYARPQPVYVAPAPVYAAPAPVYYGAPSVVVAPAPVFRPVYYDYYGRPHHWRHGHHGDRYYGR